MRLLLSLLLFLVSHALCVASDLKVDSFYAAPFDLSARVDERLDRNGNPCAVIKLQLPVEGCKFEGNIIDSRYDVNEYWVYATAGTKRIDIKCPGMKKISVVFAEVSQIEALESSVTYIMEMSGYETGPVPRQTDPGANFLIITVEPSTVQGLSVKIDGNAQSVNGNQAVAYLKYGSHSYTVEATGYEPFTGTATVTGNDKTEVTVTLRSELAQLNVKSATPGASILINSQDKGQNSWSGRLPAGSYLVEVKKNGYRPFSEMISLAVNDSRTVDVPPLDAITGTISVNYMPVGAQIKLDGSPKGTTPAVMRDILVGQHTLTISRDGYQPATVNVNVEEGKTELVEGSLVKIPVAPASQGASTLSAVQPVKDAIIATMPFHNLDLCAVRDGQAFFFTKDQWKAMPVKERQTYTKKGIVIANRGQAFVFSLSRYENIRRTDGYRLPSYAQTVALTSQRRSVRQAIKDFEGDNPEKDGLLWCDKSDLPQGYRINGRLFSLSSGDFYDKYAGDVRQVYPLYNTQGQPASVADAVGYGTVETDLNVHNLDICIKDFNGKYRFYSPSEWEYIPNQKYEEVVGIVLTGNNDTLIVSGTYSLNPVTWNDAATAFGENVLPSHEQCRIIAENADNLYKTMGIIGSPLPAETIRFWGKGDGATTAYSIIMSPAGAETRATDKTELCNVWEVYKIVKPQPEAAKGYGNLDLCAIRDGKPYYFSLDAWNAMKTSEQKKYKKKGIVIVVGEDLDFVLSLNPDTKERKFRAPDPKTQDRMLKQREVKYFLLPNRIQLREILFQRDEIDKAIIAFGGKLPPQDKFPIIWSKDSSEYDYKTKTQYLWVADFVRNAMRSYVEDANLHQWFVAPVNDVSLIKDL